MMRQSIKEGSGSKIFKTWGSAIVVLVLMAFMRIDVAQAKVTTLAPMRMMVLPGDNIFIKGYRGQVEYVARDYRQDLAVEVKELRDDRYSYSDEWQFNLRREGQQIVIQIDGPTSKNSWHELMLSGQIPQYHLRIEGPSLPIRMNWHGGRLVVNDLKSDLNITSIASDVLIQKGEGAVHVFNQPGSISIKERKGDLDLETYSAKTEILGVEGQVKVENFIGETRVSGLIGNLNLDSFSGTSKIAEVKGGLAFKNGKAPLHIDKFEGELNGRTAQGPIYAEIRGEANVRMESEDGSVNLKVPASGAWVNVGSAEGSILVPNFFKSTRSESKQIRTGRLRGGSNGGHIFVRTNRGNIRVR